MFKNILALIGLATVLFFSVGYFMKWYTVSWDKGHLSLGVDTDEVKKDLQAMKEKAAAALSKQPDAPPQPQEPGLNSFFSPKPAPPQPGPGSSLQLPRNGQ